MDAKRLTARAPALKGVIVDSVMSCRIAACTVIRHFVDSVVSCHKAPWPMRGH